MKTIVAIEADFERSPIGTVSRLADDLAGTPVLRRTVERALGAERPVSVHVIVRADQHDRAAELVGDLNVRIESHEAGTPPGAELARTARKWSLDGWRGGIGGACWFDEYTHTAILAALGKREEADGVAIVPAAAALIDPVLLDAMIDQFESIAETHRLTFAAAPPGLAGLLVRPDLLDELTTAGRPISHLLAYRPEDARGGYLNTPYCYQTTTLVAGTSARLLADTDRGVETLSAVLKHAGNGTITAPGAERICEWLNARPPDRAPLPREVELELTTEDQLRDTQLRPRGDAVPRRGPIDVAVVRRLVDELRTFDDALLVLGGFGEPLLCPQFAEILEICRPTQGSDGDGVFGLTVRTNGLALDRPALERLAAHRVDVVLVTLDAHSAETYRAVHGTDAFACVNANLEGLMQWRQQTRCVRPMLVPELIKARETFDDMESFFDHWIGRVGSAVIRGYSHCAGQLPDRAVMNMAPVQRCACRRLTSRCLVLADGRVVACDQDFAGKQVLGDLTRVSLHAVWTGQQAKQIHACHVTGELAGLPLCPRCDEWHRP